MMQKSQIKQSLKRLENYYNPKRFQEIEQLHKNAFDWQGQGRIPLGIHVVNPEHGKGLSYNDVWLNPEVFLDIQAKQLADTLEVGSDTLPVIGINHFGDAVLTSLFGAKQHMPDNVGASLNEVGPTPLAVYSNIVEVAEIEAPSLDSGLMSDVENFARYYNQNLPSWVYLVGPMPTGVFSAAMELRGSSMLMDLIDRPELCKKLISLCANRCVLIEQEFRRIVGTALDKPYSNFGVLGAGLRLGEDSICNISREMIMEFCGPAFTQVNDSFGGMGHIHFCSLPHSRFEHIYPALLEMPEVAVVSSQFGFEYYQQNIEKLRDKLAVESFYGDAYEYVCEKYGSFEVWANEFVPRFKNKSGLVLYMNASCVAEGKRIWEIWQRAHEN